MMGLLGTRVWWFLRRLTIDLPRDKAIRLPNIQSKEPKPVKHLCVGVQSSVIRHSPKVEANQCLSTAERRTRICAHLMGDRPATEREEEPAHATTWANLEEKHHAPGEKPDTQGHIL